MTRATLSDVLQPALRNGYAVAGVVCLGWEDMRAYTLAAEAEGCPIILQAGPGCRGHTPLPVLGAMFAHLAEQFRVPVVSHLDHGYTAKDCRIAIDCGFSSVMFDGSRLSLDDNIEQTRAIVEMAHAAGVSCEGEIGFVGYAEGEQSLGTDPEEAARFAHETGVDALAVSVGNVHLQTKAGAGLDRARIAAIQAVTSVPLVIHGGSGVGAEERRALAHQTSICKYNIGTELRQIFGSELRRVMAEDPNEFDRVALMSRLEAPIEAETRKVLRNLMA